MAGWDNQGKAELRGALRKVEGQVPGGHPGMERCLPGCKKATSQDLGLQFCS